MIKYKKDVFRSFLVSEAQYGGKFEFPAIKTSSLLPESVIPFSKAMNKSCKCFDSWIVFYEHDNGFERLWHNPKAYLSKLKKFKGIISPDFSSLSEYAACHADLEYLPGARTCRMAAEKRS